MEYDLRTRCAGAIAGRLDVVLENYPILHHELYVFERPDIVVADIGLPKRSGYDVASFIKSQPANWRR